MGDDQQVGPGLFVKLGLNTSELVGGVGGIALALNQSLQLFQQFEQMGRGAFDATVGAAINLQEQIQQFSYVTGMSTDQTQKWRAAAIATSTDFGSLTFSLQYLNGRITDTSTAGDNFRKTLTDMGVAVKNSNGDYIDNDTLLKNILESFGKMSTAQEKDAAAKAIFGRSWSNLAEMINKSGDALDAYNKEKPNFTEEDLKNIDDAKTAWAKLSDTIYLAGANAGVAVIKISEGIRVPENQFATGPRTTSIIPSAGESTGTGPLSSPFGEGKDIFGNTVGGTRSSNESAEYGDPDYVFDADYEAAKARGTFKGSYSDWKDFQTVMKSPMNNVDETAPKSGTSIIDPFAGLDTKSAKIKELTDEQTTLYNQIHDGSERSAEAVEKLWYQYHTLTDEISATKSATDDLTTAQSDLASAQSKMSDLTKDYTREMGLAVGDPGKARELTTRYNWAVEDQRDVIKTDKANVAAEAVKYGDINITLDGKTTTIKGAAAAGSETKLYDPFNLTTRSLTRAGYT